MSDRWQTILAVDFDKHAVATYRANFPGVDVRCAGVETIVPELREEPATTISVAGGNAIPEIFEYRWSDAMLAKHPPASPASPAPTLRSSISKGGATGALVEYAISPEMLAKMREHEIVGGHVNTRELDPAKPSRTVGAKNPTACTGDALRIRTPLLVRRLAPLECMRLQSAPDTFVWPEKITKTAMYRICGNGQASLMVAHLSREMALSDPDSRTAIDLFCGGGLGACGWHGRFWSYEASPTSKGSVYSERASSVGGGVQ